MKLLLILSCVLIPAELLTIQGNANTDSVKDEDGQQEKYLKLSLGKCADISKSSGKPDQEDCVSRCKELKNELADGECLEGVCICKFDISQIINNTKSQTVKGKTGKKKSRQGVKCKNLIRLGGTGPSQNHKGCGIHCRLLNAENKDGRCVEGICQCSKELDEKKPVKEEEKEESDECMNDENCTNDCEGPSEEPRCVSGVCRCRVIPQSVQSNEIPTIEREVKKCEHRRKVVSNEICRAHCSDFSRDHMEGRCIDGVCQCGYAVFETMEPRTDSPKVEAKTRRRRPNNVALREE